MRAHRLPRLLRASVAASLATFGALMSHVTAGGAMPAVLGVAVPFILALAVCTMLAGRRLSLVRLSISVVMSQLLFHTLFVLGAPSSSTAATATHAHHHGAATVIPAAGDQLGAAWCADPLMWFSHAFAAVVTIAALHRGERAVRMLLALGERLRTWTVRLVTRAVTAASISGAPAPSSVPSDTPLWALHAAPALRLLRRRGPPLLPVL